jgi:hypothetical protein
MSNQQNEQFIEARAEQYLEEGYSPKEAWQMAQEDFEYDQYDHEPDWHEYDIEGDLDNG